MRYLFIGLFILAISSGCAPKQAGEPNAVGEIETPPRLVSDQQPVAPGKFIPTFALYYGRPKGSSFKDAPRFDLIDAGVRAASNAGTWRAMKQQNLHLKLLVYQMGPSEFSVGRKAKAGQGWDWVTAKHGAGSADRWTAIGAKYGDYLQGHEYSSERLMIIGNPSWQQFWLDEVVKSFWSGKSLNRDADGVFSDNTNDGMPSEKWHRQGYPKQPDVPADYYRHGIFQAEVWKKQLRGFVARAAPWLADRGREIVPNFGYMGKHPEGWADLDSMPHPVFGAMEEGAFATPWGEQGVFTFYSEPEWLNQVNTLRRLKHVRALMLVHGLPPSLNQKHPPRPSVSLMDWTDADGNRAWDVLWFGITSFLQGYDDVRQNAYFAFTVWGYIGGLWMDEFDPAHLDLGRAIGESHRVDAAIGHCYMREFEAAWAVVNPTDWDAKGVAVPMGLGRVLDHDSFEHADDQPLVSQFDLGAHRGVVVLKMGRRVGGNQAGANP